MDDKRGFRELACRVLVAAALAGCGSPSGTPAVPADPAEPADAATTPHADTAPETPAPAPDATRDAGPTARDISAPAADAFAPGPGGGGTADTCMLLRDAVLPSCTTSDSFGGCPLDPSSSTSVAVEVLELRGYDDLGTHAFMDHVNLLLSCWDEAGEAAPETPVVVRFTLDVDPSGCAAVRDTSGDWPTRRTRECVRGVMEWLKLPAPDSGGNGKIELQLEFAR
jgi:hypothetical protein